MDATTYLQSQEVRRRAALPPTRLFARLSERDRTRLKLADAYYPQEWEPIWIDYPA